jgi:hypothetical protein
VTTDSTTPIAPEPFDPTEPATFPPEPVTAAPATPLVKPKSSSRVLNAVLAVALLVAVGGVAFAVGRSTAPVAATGRGNFPGGGLLGVPQASLAPGESAAPGGFLGGAQGGFGGLGGGVTVSGTVQSMTGDTLTIETASGQTVEISLDADTTYHRQADASAPDVTAGASVQVQLDFGGGFGRPTASADPSGTAGTASSVTVVP